MIQLHITIRTETEIIDGVTNRQPEIRDDCLIVHSATDPAGRTIIPMRRVLSVNVTSTPRDAAS